MGGKGEVRYQSAGGPKREAQGYSRLFPTAPSVLVALECALPFSPRITLTYLSLAQVPPPPGSPPSLLPTPRLGGSPPHPITPLEPSSYPSDLEAPIPCACSWAPTL